MTPQSAEAPVGWVARLRAARRRVALFSAPESRRARVYTFALLTLLTAVLALITATAGPVAAPPLALTVPVVLAAFLLQRRALQLLLALVAIAFLTELADLGWHEVRVGSVLVLIVIGVIAVELARDRERLGLSVGRGESMLLELRDTLVEQGELPALPRGWCADVALRSAGGSGFGGDFMVSTLIDGGRRLELALVDVSGKGVDAGTRALLLSGALGGLLGAVPPERFLDAANDYVLRQAWTEGFATAVHVTVHFGTGQFRVSTAGHPPPAHYAGGSGRWTLIEPEGTILGLTTSPDFGVAEGALARYDALLLYTDGVVEMPGRDLELGIDRLLGAAESLIPRGFEGGAQQLVDEVRTHGSDDRAVALLWRT